LLWNVIGCCAGVLCGCPVDEEVMSSLSPLFACAIFYLFILSQHDRCVNWDIDENRVFRKLCFLAPVAGQHEKKGHFRNAL
jgi:hypothetical protein